MPRESKASALQKSWGVHRGMFAIGALLLIGGFLGVNFPREIALEHPTHTRRGLFSRREAPEMLTENATLVYGFVTMAVGLVVMRLAFMRRPQS